jgi:hypothetical protein
VDVDVESTLPEEIRSKAILSDREFAWRREDVFEALNAARVAQLASLGGQVQYLFPDGTCELYWLNFDPADRKAEEPWAEYVHRSHLETAEGLRRLLETVDIESEAVRSFELIRAKAGAGADLSSHLVFVCYFQAEDRGDPVQPGDARAQPPHRKANRAAPH